MSLETHHDVGIGTTQKDGLVTRDSNNHLILRQKPTMTFNHSTPYLKVDPDLFYSMLAELGWEQTNNAGSRGFDKKDSTVFTRAYLESKMAYRKREIRLSFSGSE